MNTNDQTDPDSWQKMFPQTNGPFDCQTNNSIQAKCALDIDVYFKIKYFFERRMQFLQFKTSPSGIIMSQEIYAFVKNTLPLECHGKSIKAAHLLTIFPFYSLYFNAFSISYV